MSKNFLRGRGGGRPFINHSPKRFGNDRFTSQSDYEPSTSYNRHDSYRQNSKNPSYEQHGNKRYEDGGKNSQDSGSNRPPPGLKGKAIGLWYRDRNRDKQAANGNVKPSNLIPTIFLKQDEMQDILKTINGLSRKFESKHFNKDIWDVLNGIEDSPFKAAYKANIEGNILSDQRSVIPRFESLALCKDAKLDKTLQEDQKKKEQSRRYQSMMAVRQKLPAYQMRQQIVDVIEKNQVVVLSGETGCGKTTQVPQLLLDAYVARGDGSQCRIICTQPRRISAIAVAERVADERAESLGKSVGYQIRLESVLPSTTAGSVLYCTTGIIIQWLQSDPCLANVSHLILDEIHERDSLSDFLICIAKDLIKIRPDLKIVLMSATLNAQKFSQYFDNCPMIHIPGFMYDVKEYYLEDVVDMTSFRFQSRLIRNTKTADQIDHFENKIAPKISEINPDIYPRWVIRDLLNHESEELNLNLILALIKHIVAEQGDGAILIFLPGWEQISNLHKLIENETFFSASRFLVIPLHSLMPTTNQREVFERPRRGIRKIVISTPIAETSITIDDVVFVIDGGYMKIKNYDKVSNSSTLLPEFVTLANAKQRRGRAGRVQEGICYHLFTRARESFLDSFPLPEIQRTRLEEAVLHVKALKLGSAAAFLSKVLDAPDEDVVELSIKTLKLINAIDDQENLTPLGFHLARLPTDPLTGKMLLMASLFSCLSPVLTVAATINYKDPFVMSLNDSKLVDKCRQSHGTNTESDHLMMANVYHEWNSCNGSDARCFARENFLSTPILLQLKKMRKQLVQLLYKDEFISSPDEEHPSSNRNSHDMDVVKAVVAAGLYPNIAKITKNHKGVSKRITLADDSTVQLHPKSINRGQKKTKHSWYVFWNKMKTINILIHDTSNVSNYSLLFFGHKFGYDAETKMITVDDFVEIKSEAKQADALKKVRAVLDRLLEYKVSHPNPTNWSRGDEAEILNLIVRLLNTEEGDGVHKEEKTKKVYGQQITPQQLAEIHKLYAE